MEKYNLPNEEIKRFEIYDGMVLEQMPKLISEGRIPASVSKIMKRRLELRNDETGVKNFYLNNCFDTGDAFVYHPDGRVKIVLDSQNLRELNLERSSNNPSALALTEDIYKALDGAEFKIEKLKKFSERLGPKETKNHPVWKILARDKKLLEDYVDYIFFEMKQKFGFDFTTSIYLDHLLSDDVIIEMMPFDIGDLNNGFYILGAGSVGYGRSRMLGIASYSK